GYGRPPGHARRYAGSGHAGADRACPVDQACAGGGMTGRRLSLVWPLLIIAAAVVWLLYALGVLPASIGDLIGRAWPLVLVLVGLMLFLGRRVRFGNVLSIVLCAILVGAVVSTAYSQQSSKV